MDYVKGVAPGDNPAVDAYNLLAACVNDNERQATNIITHQPTRDDALRLLANLAGITVNLLRAVHTGDRDNFLAHMKMLAETERDAYRASAVLPPMPLDLANLRPEALHS
jgi:hypothetical protein